MLNAAMNDVTQILQEIETGDQAAADELLPLVYEELRKLASQRMSEERKNHTLQATALVHEAYVRLVNVPNPQEWNSRGHFFAAAAEAMRRILVEQARRKRGPASGGQHQHVEFRESHLVGNSDEFDILSLNEAIDELAEIDERAANLVKLRFFAGLTRDEAAQSLGVSVSTVDDDWAYAKGWLRSVLKA